MKDNIFTSSEKRSQTNWFIRHAISTDLLATWAFVAGMFYFIYEKTDMFVFAGILHAIGLSYIVARTIRNKNRMNIKSGWISSETYMFWLLWAFDIRFIFHTDQLWGLILLACVQVAYNLCRGECYRIEN